MAKPGARKRKSSKIGDVALIVDRTEDNDGFQVLRKRGEEHPVELVTIRPLKEGRQIDGEVVSLAPRKDVPFAYDVKTELPDQRRQPSEKRLTSDGPPQVATEDYRRGWEAIWGHTAGNKPN